jgi:LmbE family N-acetylglucosaminyl deacetylase
MNWAARLASGDLIGEPVAIVVAHPDDETLWTGSLLPRLADATLILLTDGAPENMTDARRLGFASRGAYAEHRLGELTAALKALEARPRLIRYGLLDQGTIDHLPELIDRLRADLAGVACVITHPYEGGHPDHDAAALAVSLAATSPVVEFACYAEQDGARLFGRFVPNPDAPEHGRALDAGDRRRVAAALAAHASQAAVFGDWRPDTERWRPAPAYDFTRAPPGDAVLYDRFGWTLTSARWRERATSFVAAPA